MKTSKRRTLTPVKINWHDQIITYNIIFLAGWLASSICLNGSRRMEIQLGFANTLIKSTVFINSHAPAVHTIHINRSHGLHTEPRKFDSGTSVTSVVTEQMLWEVHSLKRLTYQSLVILKTVLRFLCIIGNFQQLRRWTGNCSEHRRKCVGLAKVPRQTASWFREHLWSFNLGLSIIQVTTRGCPSHAHPRKRS